MQTSSRYGQAALFAAALAIVLTACTGDTGPAGPAGTNGATGATGPQGPSGPSGPAGASAGTVAGTVTVSGVTPALPLAGATVTFAPAAVGTPLTTDANGQFTASVPVGVYTLTFASTNFGTKTASVSVTAAGSVTQNVALVPTAPVVVSIATTGAAAPGATINATATILTLDGSTVTAGTAQWSQVGATAGAVIGEAPAVFATPTANATDVTLGSEADFKASLFKALTISPLADLDSDPNAPLEDGQPFTGGLQNRFKVQAINHHDVEKAGEVTLKFTVTTSSGTYSATKALAAALPWGVTAGTGQVAVGQRIVLHGKDLVAPQTAYAYTLTTVPASSAAALDDAAAQNPSFVPDKEGTYVITESNSGAAITVVAASWVGAINAAATLAGLDANGVGTPVGSSACTGCHRAGGFAPDMFTPWSQSGHAQIFTQNVNAGGHYGEACFDCHMVGWDKNVVNGGVDEKSDYNAMLAGIFTVHGSPPTDPLNWKNILTTYPATAAMSNIQCENCHGPNSTHDQSAAEHARRVSLDAGVCARCHGEPARHGRYQEWQLSRHASYDVAIGEGFNTDGTVRNTCAGCHTGQGFLLFVQQLKSGNASRTLTPANIAKLQDPVTGMTPDTVEPQTCATCHDPHDAGTISSLGTDAKLRVQNDTPLLPSGFQALGVGRGALCITCHNSRNGEKVSGSGIVGLHEDGDTLWGTLTAYAAPHEAAQGDVLMGRNAYFVAGGRGAHSTVPDACVRCHMESTPPDPAIGYPTQSNHTFELDITICTKCHVALDGEALQGSIAAEIGALETAFEAAFIRAYNSQVPAPTTPATTAKITPGRTPTVSINGATAINLITALPQAAAPIDTDIFAKANWNWELIAVDASGGVHNPSFAHEVLFETTQKLNAVTTAQ